MDEFVYKRNLEGSFGQCLKFLLFTHGVRPDGLPEKVGKPWSQTEFANALSLSSRAIRYWLDDEKLPGDLQSIERVLFGASNKYSVWRLDLRQAHGRARDRELPHEASRDASKPSPGIVLLHPDIRSVPSFTGREDLLAGIEAALWQKGGTVALTNDAASAVMKGLGGVGKSVLAREYAWRMRGRYHGVWWARAETEQTLIDDLIDLGSRLIPNLKEVQERDRALHLALDAIAGADRDKPWLIVYDNVEKPGAIARLTPKTGAHILITSRWPRWQGHAQELPVDVFPEDVAVDFLRAERPHETGEAAGRLAAALGLLPLALSHARAYCAETNLSFDDYARRLSELIQEAPEDAEYPASVFATFSLAIAKAAEACPEAEKLMEIAAFLAPERIPLDIITVGVMNAKQREKAIAALFRISLLTHETTETGAPALTVHRVVQDVMRERLGDGGEEARRTAFRLTSNALQAVAVREHINWPYVATLLPHAIVVLDAVDGGDQGEEISCICNLLGSYFEARGDYPTAQPYLERALAIVEVVLGKDHLETGPRLNNLAGLYLRQGRYSEAEPLFLRAWAIAEAAHGADHPETGTSLNNLANLYRGQGRYSEAEPLYLRARAIVEAAHGADHPETSTGFNNLARLYDRQGRHSEAEPLYLRALAIAEAAVGPDHPETRTSLNNLAYFYERQGRYNEAELLVVRALAISEVAFGADHPETGTNLNNLGNLYRSQDRYSEAEALYLRALAIAEAALGRDHPTTGIPLWSLARMRFREHRYSEADSLYLRTLEIFGKRLAPDHLYMIQCKAQYAHLRQAMASDL